MYVKLSNYIILCLTFFILLNANSQNFRAKIYYKTTTSVDLDKFTQNGIKYTEEQKKAFASFMKDYLVKNYVLIIENQESLYQQEDNIVISPTNQPNGYLAAIERNFSGISGLVD